MATRTHAREMVVELLYAYTMGNERIFDFADELLNAKKIRNAQADFAKGLFNGVVAHLQNIDSIIEANLKSWELSRLGVIDKCILRLGVYEILKGEIDAPVAINEAIEIAKILGAENTGRFVNGVLDAIRKGGFDLEKGVDNLVLGMQFRAKNAESTHKKSNNFVILSESEESQKNLILSKAKYLKNKNRDSSLRLRSAQNDNFKESAESALDSANLQNLDKNQSREAQPLKSVVGGGGGERLRNSSPRPLPQKKRAFGRKGSKKQIYLPSDSNKKAKPIKSQNSRKDLNGGLPRFAKGKSRNDKSFLDSAKRTRNDNIKSQKSAQRGNKK